MNSKLINVLGAVCVVLLFIILGELFFAKLSQDQLLESTKSPVTKAPLDEMPAIDLTRNTEDSYEDLIARPLFLEGRKPVNEPTAAEEAKTNAVEVKFDWLLNGVYTSKNGLSALFSRGTLKVPKDNYRRIKLGTDLDGWKLTEILKDRVKLTQDSVEKELLLRKPKLKQAPQKPNAQARPPAPGEAVPPPEETPEGEPEPEFETPEESLENSDNEQF